LGRTNTEVAQGKITKNNSNDSRELLLGILVWPGLFDLKNADGNEANALLDQNICLRELAKGKSCAAVDARAAEALYNNRRLGGVKLSSHNYAFLQTSMSNHGIPFTEGLRYIEFGGYA
jgi:hypothetical protein